MIRNKTNVMEYTWGEHCKGWHLLKSDTLGIIQEIMPPSTSEVEHQHSKAQQFFFILEGEATFYIEGKKYTVPSGQGIHIPKKTFHKIINDTKEQLEFIVVSEPHAHGDRVLK